MLRSLPRPPASRWSALAVAWLALAAACQPSLEQRLDEVRALHDSAAFEETIEPLRGILRSQPGHPEASYRLGLALVRTGSPSLAVPHLQRAAEAGGAGTEAGPLLASTLLGLGNLEQALDAANEALQRNPENRMAILVRAKAALEKGDAELALADAEGLIAVEPDSFEALSFRALALDALDRKDEALGAFEQLESAFEQSDDMKGLQSCFYLAAFLNEQGEIEPALAQGERCIERFPSQPTAVNLALQLFDSRGETKRGDELLRSAIESDPTRLEIRSSLAERLASRGEQEAALATMREGAEQTADFRGWHALAQLERRLGEDEAARASLERADELAAGRADVVRFLLAEVLVDLGELDKAATVAGQLPDAAQRDLIQGRILLERGDPEAALALLNRSIQAWPDNPEGRFAAARASLELGRTGRAMTELREATRKDPGGNDAALILARLHMARGEFAEAGRNASRQVQHRGFTGPEAHLIGARASWMLGNRDNALSTLEDLGKSHEEYRALAVAERARLVRMGAGAEAATRVIRESGLDLTDPGNREALVMLASLEFERGRAAEALAAVRAAAKAHPDDAFFQALLGRTALQAGDLEAGRTALGRALELDADNPPALAGQAELEFAAGRAGEALALLDRAAEASDSDAEYRFRAAQIELARGNAAEAERRLRSMLTFHPEHAGAANDLAWHLADKGEDLDFALELARRAARLAPEPSVIDTLGWVHLRRGEAEQASTAFGRALERRPGEPTFLYHLGLARLRGGDEQGAREAFETALETGSFPESEAARAELARLSAGAEG